MLRKGLRSCKLVGFKGYYQLQAHFMVKTRLVMLFIFSQAGLVIVGKHGGGAGWCSVEHH